MSSSASPTSPSFLQTLATQVNTNVLPNVPASVAALALPFKTIATLVAGVALTLFSITQPLFYLGASLGLLSRYISTVADTTNQTQASVVNSSAKVTSVIISLIARSPFCLIGYQVAQAVTEKEIIQLFS